MAFKESDYECAVTEKDNLLSALPLTLSELRYYSDPEVRRLAEEIVTRVFVLQQVETGQRQIDGSVK